MQKTWQKFRQSSSVSKKPGIFPEKLKALNKIQLPMIWTFVTETLHTFSTWEGVKQGTWDFFKILFESSYLKKQKKTCFLYTHRNHFLKFLLITQDPKKIIKQKQNPKQPSNTL